MKQLSKIQKIFTLFVLGVFVFTPLFSYAFSSLNLQTDTTNIQLQENDTDDTSNSSLLINNLTTSDESNSNSEPESENEININSSLNLKNTNSNEDDENDDSASLFLRLNNSNEDKNDENDNNEDEDESVSIDLFDTKDELNDADNSNINNIQIKTNNKNTDKKETVNVDLFNDQETTNKIKLESEKKEQEDKAKKRDEKSVLNINAQDNSGNKTPNTKKQNNKKLNKESKKNKEYDESDFKGILDINNITNILKLEKKEKNNYLEDMEYQDEDILEFVKTIDTEKSLENMAEAKRKRINEMCQAMKNAKIAQIIKNCKAYYANLIEQDIVYYYNESKLYDDRAKKIMIGFELWSQTTEVPEMVTRVMNRALYKVRKNGANARYALSNSSDNPHKSIDNETRVGDNIHWDYCYYVEDSYREDLYDSGIMSAIARTDNQRWWIKTMKIIIEEFTKDKPFSKTFLLNLGCAFEHSYVENLPPEEYHYCNKDKNPFYH